MTPEEKRMLEIIDENRDKIHKIAKKIWEFKEVGWEEFQSSTLLMNALEKRALKFNGASLESIQNSIRTWTCLPPSRPCSRGRKKAPPSV